MGGRQGFGVARVLRMRGMGRQSTKDGGGVSKNNKDGSRWVECQRQGSAGRQSSKERGGQAQL